MVCQNFTDRSCAFKGKRTKRSRPSSPLNTAGTTTTIITTTSSSIAGGSNDTGGGGGGGGGDFYNSPTTSTTQISTTSTSEEDEDMANCLILLAQSGCGQKVQEVKKEKINSRKFAEMANSTTGKAGFFVYECKTCNRTFNSFQALGGHRASHKKPKIIVEEKKSVTVNTDTDTAPPAAAAAAGHDDLHDQEQGRLNKMSSTSISSQITISKTKIHECSICGSEFSSGQALGGHMRRHRQPPTTTMTPETNVSESSSCHHEEKSRRNVLALDLNLPAPTEDDHKFEQSLVFSAASMVDCYY